MGGLQSGRTRKHVSMNDCLELDTTWLKKHNHLPGPASFVLTWKRWSVINFNEREKKIHEYHAGIDIRQGNEGPRMTVIYTAQQQVDGRPGQQSDHTHTIPLVSTPCHYGGVRWWFAAPCCYRRVRVLYINLKAASVQEMQPLCRDCAELHYASQQASYIERHIAYEKHLLRNYGYYWAYSEYHMMRQHYFKVTPEWEYIRERSRLDREIELLRHYISFERVLLRTHIRSLTSLRSEEDRRMYMDHVIKEHGQDYALDLVRVIKLGSQVERDSLEFSPPVFERLYRAQVQAEEEETGEQYQPGGATNLANLYERRDEYLAELAELKAQKKAA